MKKQNTLTGKLLSIVIMTMLSLLVTSCIDQSVIGSGAQDQEFSSYQGIPVGFTEDGHPYLGEPDAPVTLEEYSDFLCPFCARHFQMTVPELIENYVKTGQVRYVFYDMPLVGLHPTAPLGHIAARCVAQQGVSKFWAMHTALFSRQNEWNQLPDPNTFLAEVAAQIGVKESTYEKCISDGNAASLIQESVAIGQALGFNGTPSFRFVVNETGDVNTMIGAYPFADFATRLDALLAGEEPPVAQEPEPDEPAELPYWANSQGLSPDPERPGFTLAGDPYKGNPEAQLVVIEFSDFQCPACQQHALAVQPTLDTEFIDTGEILWIFKNLPLRGHANAPAAAVAAECAGEQGWFWEMHDLLFTRLDDWSDGNPDELMTAFAVELDLESAGFNACYNSRQALERVLADLYDAQGIINTTPNFVMLHDGKGTLMDSSLPVDQFVAALQGRLDSITEADNSQP